MYAISYEDLLKIGKEKLSPEDFRDAIKIARDTRVEAECIISGFADGFPMLLQTTVDGQVLIREDFAVVGEGAYLAQAMLLHRAHSDIRPFLQALYTVYEAKKFAEGARSVGQYTSIACCHADKERDILTFEGLSFLDSMYRKFGPQPLKLDTVKSPKILKPLSEVKLPGEVGDAEPQQSGVDAQADAGSRTVAPKAARRDEAPKSKSVQDVG
jgi:hypothetical protein